MKRIFNIILCSLLVGQLAFAQEVAKDRMFVISNFESLATKPSPYGLDPKFATIAENVRFGEEIGAMLKRDKIYTYGTADTSEAITGMHRLYLSGGTKVLLVNHGDEIETGVDATGVFTAILDISTANYRWQWLTWHDLGIGTDGYNQPVKYDGSSASATYLGTCLATVSAAAGNPNGTYTYKVSFYTTSYEVIFNVPSNSIAPSSKQVSLSQIPIGPDTYLGEAIIGRKVYRVEGGTWKLLSNGTIANNTATTLTDNDATASGAAYPAGKATWTPPKCKLSIIHKNRLWLANNPTYPSRIYYSKDGSHDLFETSTDYFDIRANDGDEITFVKNLLGKLAVGKTNPIQKIYTDGDIPESDWAVSDPYVFIGCQAPYSADTSPIGIIYLGRDGLYVFNGQSSRLLSDKITPTIKDILPSNLKYCWGIYHKNKYYLAYPSASVGGSINNRVLVYDLLTQSFSIDILSVNIFTAFNSGTDFGTLYSGSSSNGAVYFYESAEQEIVHSKHSDFIGTFDDMRYIPTSVGGDSDNPIIELAWDLTIDTYGAGTINAATGIIDRPDTNGTYTSQTLYTPNARSYRNFYWNQIMPSCGGTVTAQIDTSSDGVTWDGYSAAFNSGADISGTTSKDYTRYKISISTNDIDYTPNLVKSGGYVTRLTYSTLTTTPETTIALHYKTGWFDIVPGYVKTLKKLICLHEGTSGIVTLTFTNLEGDTDTFTIDLSVNPKQYEEYFTTGRFRGTWFNLDISNSDLNSLKIKKIILVYDAEPLV